MGERFGESVWDGWAQEQTEKRIADMTAKKVLEAQRQNMPSHSPRHYTTPTHKDVLLKTWAQDTKKMASETIGSFFNDYFRRYELPDGVDVYDIDEAIKHYIAYLNSAAEVGKNV